MYTTEGSVRICQLVVNKAINPRSDAGNVDGIKAQIKTKGFNDPLWVRQAPGIAEIYEVIDGGRRLKALLELCDEGIMQISDVVSCTVFNDCSDQEASELALAVIEVREGLSPADEAEAFYRLRISGLDEESIAVRFGKSVKLVRQRIALGGLHPEILQALRQGNMPIEVAQAFTLSTSPERQLEVFKTLKHLNRHSVASAFANNGINDDDPRAQFVGLDAYELAGGKVTRDLFSEAAWLNDGVLLQRLADEKLEQLVTSFKDDGWSFVDVIKPDGKAHAWNYSQKDPGGTRTLSADEQARLDTLIVERGTLQKQIDAADEDQECSQEDYDTLMDGIDAVQAEIRTLEEAPFTAKQKRKLGVVITTSHYDITIGVARPLQANAAAKNKHTADDEPRDADEGEPAPAPVVESLGYTDTTLQVMAVAAHNAVKLEMVTVKPALTARLGLAARVIAHPLAGDFGRSDCFLYSHQEMGAGEKYLAARQTFFEKHFPHPEDENLEFIAALMCLEKMDPTDITQLEAFLTADHFRLTSLANVDARFIYEMLEPAFGVDTGEGFAIDAEFLGRMSRRQLTAAAQEISPTAKPVTGKKPDMVAALLPTVTLAGWLPQPMRGPSYHGPGSADWAERIAEAAMPKAGETTSGAAAILTLADEEAA